jgi:DNA-binding CsgD family transcriptional regulator
MRARDLVALVESAYGMESTEDEWLRAIAERMQAFFGGQDLGAYGLTYDASDVADCRFSAVVPVAIQSEKVRRVMLKDAPLAYRGEPNVVEAIFRRTPYGLGSNLPTTERNRQIYARLASLGVVDILGLNGVNVDGRGAHVGILMSRPIRGVAPGLLARVSSHLAAGFRLRRRLGSAPRVDSAEAILDPSGRVEHATGVAKLREAREELSEAAARIDRLRASTRKRDPQRALEEWRALIRARWSLVDHFEHDGKRYLLAQRNDPEPGPVALLSTRERQVVALAAIGHANKMIGYELGISVSTAGVLLSRAAKKIGAQSRADLIRAYEAHQTRQPRSR